MHTHTHTHTHTHSRTLTCTRSHTHSHTHFAPSKHQSGVVIGNVIIYMLIGRLVFQKSGLLERSGLPQCFLIRVFFSLRWSFSSGGGGIFRQGIFHWWGLFLFRVTFTVSFPPPSSHAQRGLFIKVLVHQGVSLPSDWSFIRGSFIGVVFFSQRGLSSK